MEKLGNIIKNYKPNSTEKDLEVVKQVLHSEKLRFNSVRIYQHKIIVTVPDHIAATELRYKQRSTQAKLKAQNINFEVVSRIS